LVGDFLVEVVVELLFQDAEVGGFFRAEEGGELVSRDLVVVVGGSDLLGESIVVGGVLEILTEGSEEDVSTVFAEDVGEGIGAVDEPGGGSELDAALVGTHDVYIVSQHT
jgi:hypothetical protein